MRSQHFAARRFPSPGLECDELDYLLLEAARLQCEALITSDAADVSRSALRLTHRELSYAGYVASAAIEPDRRHALLVSARQSRAVAQSELADPAQLLQAAATAED